MESASVVPWMGFHPKYFWLKAAYSNPRVIVGYFIQPLEEFGGYPRTGQMQEPSFI